MAKEILRRTMGVEQTMIAMADGDIRADQDVQRLSGQWTNENQNELHYTLLTHDYMPPIIVGKETRRDGSSQEWCLDGLQRLSTIAMFKNGNYKITSKIDNPYVTYHSKVVDDNGDFVLDDAGDFVKEEKVCDIRGKRFNDLPIELQKLYNNYSIDFVVHLDVNMQEMSKLVRRYNNHKAMNASQKALTYVDVFARQIRKITNNNYFKDCGHYTQAEKKNGTLQRIPIESVMCVFHMDDWKKPLDQMGKYVNEHATSEEFDTIASYLNRLIPYTDEEDNPAVAKLFSSKNTFIWLKVFNEFNRLGLSDDQFGSFLNQFVNGLNKTEVDGRNWASIDSERGTKDKSIVLLKINYLVTLMNDFLKVDEEIENNNIDDEESDLNFIRNNVDKDITDTDVELYEDTLNDLTLNVDNDTQLLDQQNHKSLLAMVAHSFVNDEDLDDWFEDFFKRTKTFIPNQKDNYVAMVNDYENYALGLA